MAARSIENRPQARSAAESPDSPRRSRPDKRKRPCLMPQPLQSLDLVFREEAVPASSLERGPTLAKPQLWMAVCLPNLAFDALRGPVAQRAAVVPTVVAEPQEGQVYVVAANGEARSLGIAPGAKLSAALALAASLKVLERSPRIERAQSRVVGGMGPDSHFNGEHRAARNSAARGVGEHQALP